MSDCEGWMMEGECEPAQVGLPNQQPKHPTLAATTPGRQKNFYLVERKVRITFVLSVPLLVLVQGATPPAVGWAAIDSVLLGSLHNYRLHLKDYPIFSEPSPSRDNSTRLTLFGHGIAGLGAGLTRACKRYVMDRRPKNKTIIATTPLYSKATAAASTGSLAFRANFFWMFLTIEMSEGTANFICGGLASFTYWLAAIPADNVKNRVFGSPLDSSTSVRQVIGDIYRTAGIRGFYRGLAPSILRAFPSNACAYFVYEGLLRTFGAEKQIAGLESNRCYQHFYSIPDDIILCPQEPCYR
ncbi:2930_t:CDS:2 [Acaulospora colombiana]|uniref:2930_t:CDS:1 n=1 Tax=Acaulospora colombiana TaxID=27376 RepID=A0ACA9MKD2_9GLOM|nr:2930_t:CDS:2 [Acaulospora colombiana]